MNTPNPLPKTQHIIEMLLRISLFIFMGFICYYILEPFLIVIFWAIIFATSMYPVYSTIQHRLHWKDKWNALLITIGLFILFFIPCYLFIYAVIYELHSLTDLMKMSTIHLPHPGEDVKSWPVVGNKIYEYWNDLSHDASKYAHRYEHQIEGLIGNIVQFILELGVSIVFLLLSIILSGIFLAYNKDLLKVTKAFLNKIAGDEADKMMSTTRMTILKVVKGVIGVALFQTILMSIVLFLFGIKGAGLWTMLYLISTVLQIGVIPITIPLILYLVIMDDIYTATFIGIWAVAVAILENIVKPLLLGGKETDIPMPIVFIGVMGGFIAFGFAGMFVGAVIFSIMYKLFMNWVKEA
ncbi:MAG: AI-2E family transporter [Cytophagaceae bacterium]